jgi:hypothetical protein
VAQVSKALGITEQTYYRWRKEYGGIKADQARAVEGPRAEKPHFELFIPKAATRVLRVICLHRRVIAICLLFLCPVA